MRSYIVPISRNCCCGSGFMSSSTHDELFLVRFVSRGPSILGAQGFLFIGVSTAADAELFEGHADERS